MASRTESQVVAQKTEDTPILKQRGLMIHRDMPAVLQAEQDSSTQVVVMPAEETPRLNIRWMIRRDMLEVLRTEQDSFDKSVWTEEDFLRCLRHRNCICIVVEQGERVVGFMIYELHAKKLNILNIAVSPGARRAGIGAAMVATKLVSKLKQPQPTKDRITVVVRKTNTTAQLFFQKQGFTVMSTLPKFFEDNDEDGLLMEYKLEAEVEAPKTGS